MYCCLYALVWHGKSDTCIGTRLRAVGQPLISGIKAECMLLRMGAPTWRTRATYGLCTGYVNVEYRRWTFADTMPRDRYEACLSESKV
jgi:hypothetical protein